MKKLIILTSFIIPTLAAASAYIPPNENKEPFTSACTATPRIQYREVIAVPAGTTKLQIEQAIKSSLSQRSGWFFEYINNDVAYAGLNIRSHYLKIAIKFDDKVVISAVCDSSNLDQSSRSIHRNTPVWKERLDSILRHEISIAANQTISTNPETEATAISMNSSDMDNAIQQLEKLKKLHDSEVLNDDEYAQMKKLIMDKVL